MYRLILCCVIYISSQSVYALPNSVKLSTKLWPPYHYYDIHGELTGISVNHLKCSFEWLNIDLNIEVVPWSRAQQHTQMGISDGFFSASWNASRDQYATRSVDIAPQNWVWYTLKGSGTNTNSKYFRQNAKIAGTRGSNIVHWLKKNQYKVTAETMALDNMVNMILTGRVDAFMENQFVAEAALKGSNNFAKLEKTIARSMPVGVYFSHTFLAKYPRFLTTFNKASEQCHNNKVTN